MSLVYENDADGYVAHHYTLDKKELPDEWSAVSFYGGKYSFKTEGKCMKITADQFVTRSGRRVLTDDGQQDMGGAWNRVHY